MSLAQKSLSLLSRDIFVYSTKVLTGAVIARVLGPETLGVWIILMLIPTYADAVGRLKVEVAAVYFLGTGRHRFGEVSFILMILAFLSGGVLALVGIWQVDLLKSYFFPNVELNRFLVYAVLITIPLNFFVMNCSYLLLHLEDVTSYNRLVLLQSLLASLLAVLFLVVFKWKLLSLAVATLLSVSLAAIYGLWKTQRYEKMKPNLNLAMLKEIFSYGMNFYATGLASQAYTYFSSLVAVRFISSSQLAFFRMGQDTTQLAVKFSSALNTMLFPRMTKVSPSPRESRELTERACRISVVLLAGVGLVAAVGIYPLIYFLYGEKYLPMGVPFLIILPGTLAQGMTDPIYLYLMGTGQAKVAVKLSVVPCLGQIALSLALIPIWGVVGASLATSLTFMLTAAARSFVFTRLADGSLSKILVPQTEDVCRVIDFTLSTLRTAKGFTARGAGR